MNNEGNKYELSVVFIGLGILLMVLGTLFFVGQAAGFDFVRIGWPFFVIITGIAVVGAGLAVGGTAGRRITPLGVALTMVGVILLYQNATDHFESWSYSWALVFLTAIGLGRMLYGSLKGNKEMVASGRRFALVGVALFVVGAFFFELVIGVGGFGIGLGRFGWPLGLVFAGILLLAGGLLYRRR